MENKKSNVIIIMLLIVIIVILASLVFLFATKKIVLNTGVDNQEQGKKTQVEEKIDNKEMTDVTLPGGNTISINKVFEDVFNDSKKIFVKSEGNMPYQDVDPKAYSEELTLSDLIEKEKSSYSSGIEELVGDSIVRVSKTTFDFDNDGINEIMLKLYEEYILLHYYNGEVYGYVLPGYRQNNNWEIDGTSHGSSSAFESSATKYSFSGSELTSAKSNVTTINKDNLIEFVNYTK